MSALWGWIPEHCLQWMPFLPMCVKMLFRISLSLLFFPSLFYILSRLLIFPWILIFWLFPLLDVRPWGLIYVQIIYSYKSIKHSLAEIFYQKKIYLFVLKWSQVWYSIVISSLFFPSDALKYILDKFLNPTMLQNILLATDIWTWFWVGEFLGLTSCPSVL